MKKSEHTEDLPSKVSNAVGMEENVPLQSAQSTTHAPKSRAKLFLVVSGTLFLLFISIELIVHTAKPDASGSSTKRIVAIQLEVLNGTTEPRAAERLTEALRSGGYDVVDLGNYKSSTVDHTTVIGRTADKSAAISVASFLGVDKSRVLQQPDRNLYLDVTVIVGKDINQLRVFK